MPKQTFEAKGHLKKICFTNSAAQEINNWKRQALRAIHRPRAHTKRLQRTFLPSPSNSGIPSSSTLCSMLFLTHSFKALTSRLSNC